MKKTILLLGILFFINCKEKEEVVIKRDVSRKTNTEANLNYKKIKNSKGQTAIILSDGEKLDIDIESKPFRIYYWIDDSEIKEEEIEKFKCLFEIYQLKEERYNGGKEFNIDSFDCQLFIKNIKIGFMISTTPRRAGDGGVIR